MFKENDLVMYGQTGVCKIQEVTKLDWSAAEQDRLYYVLKPLYSDDAVYVPVDNDKVFMRKLMTRKQVDDLIDTMPSVQAEIFKARSIQQLSRYYQDAINSHESMDLIKLTKSIHMKKEAAIKKNRHLGQVDIRFMKYAESLLFGEFAAVLGIPIEDVTGYIENRIKGSKS